MKKLLVSLFLLLGVFCFSAPIKEGVYTNTSSPYSGGTYYLFKEDGNMVLVYDGYYRADGNPDGIAGSFVSVNLDITSPSEGILKSENSYSVLDYSIMKENPDGSKFKLDKNGLKEDGDNKYYKYKRAINNDDMQRIEEILNPKQ